jgi:hypothetical protein
MPSTGITYPTLLDVAKRSDPDGKIATIIEQLTTTNELLQDMAWVEGNLPTGHKTTVRSGLPSATWRQLNYGVQPSKSTTTPITDQCGMLEAYAEVDKSLVMLNNNTAEFRLSEDRAFLEAMNQAMATTLFYGDTAVNPERFMGLAPRYNAYSANEALSGSNIIKAGGAVSTNSSIWLICWGPNTAHGIYPKGSKAGFSHTDLGEQTLFDTASPQGRFQGYRTHYKWDCGLSVRDWRYVVRIANIDVALLTPTAVTGANLVDLMQQAIEILRDQNMGRPVFYMNRRVRSFLRRQMNNAGTLGYGTMEQVAGERVKMFEELPVHISDAILNTEGTVA